MVSEYAPSSRGEFRRRSGSPAPGWNAGTINLAIALLNQGGEAEAKLKVAGQTELAGEAISNIDESIRLLGIVISRLPDNPWAHFSRGIIFENQGKIQEAHLDFKKVIEVDPLDANAWLELGSTMTDPEGSNILPGSKLVGSKQIDFLLEGVLNSTRT